MFCVVDLPFFFLLCILDLPFFLSLLPCMQTCELLKTLLDPETMDTAIEKNEFVELFYDK